MVHATEILGAETYDSFGNFVGRVKEMFIVPDEQPNRISRFLIGRGQYRPLVARYDQIAAVAPGRLKLTTDESALELYHPNEAWLAVQKDLLDQQIIDTNGRKVVRVNDVELADHRVNGNTELRITQVDVGLPGAVRRLLQGIVPPMGIRRIQAKASAADHPLGIRQPDRARPSAAREAAHVQRQARGTPSGRPRRHHGGTLARRAPVHHRLAR